MKSLKMAHVLDKPYYYAYAHYHLGCFYRSAIRGGCGEKNKQRYVKNAKIAFKSAVEAMNEPSADLLTGYADFLIDAEKFSPAYSYLTRAIASGDSASSLQYVWGDQTVTPHILQEKLQQEKVVTIYAQDIKARAGQPGKEKQDALASYLLNSLQNAEHGN